MDICLIRFDCERKSNVVSLFSFSRWTLPIDCFENEIRRSDSIRWERVIIVIDTALLTDCERNRSICWVIDLKRIGWYSHESSECKTRSATRLKDFDWFPPLRVQWTYAPNEYVQRRERTTGRHFGISMTRQMTLRLSLIVHTHTRSDDRECTSIRVFNLVQ